MKWKNKKDELERLIIHEQIPYEELGRRYGVSGTAVKKAAQRLGISLPQRRNINPTKTFNHREPKKGHCLNCGEEYILYLSHNAKFCSNKCQHEYQYKEYIKKWKNGETDGTTNIYSLSRHIRKYMMEKAGHKCEKCGWGEINQNTGKSPLQIHHKDGDCTNNQEENLEVLCPNCHSLTENYGSLNKNATKGRADYFHYGNDGYLERKEKRKEKYKDRH